MNKNIIVGSLTISTFLTIIFFILKLISFRDFSDLIIPFILGFFWFLFIYLIFFFLQKNFPDEFSKLSKIDFLNKPPKYLKNIFKNIKSIKKKSQKQNSIENKNTVNDLDNKEKKEGIEDSSWGNLESKKDEFVSKYSAKKEQDISVEDFDFSSKKMARAVRGFLNKDE